MLDLPIYQRKNGTVESVTPIFRELLDGNGRGVDDVMVTEQCAGFVAEDENLVTRLAVPLAFIELIMVYAGRERDVAGGQE